jgi:DNA invertase Pin-like site-specific DNA recombinase
MKSKAAPFIPRRKAFSYVRFSTPEQAKGDSRRRQEQMAIDYAERHNLELDESLRFEDLGVSAYRGKNAVEGELRTFIDAAKQGIVPEGSVLLVENLDRISRLAPLDAVNLLDEITRTGVAVATLSDGKVYERDALRHSTQDLMTAIMVAARSNEESERKADRGRQAWIGKKAKLKEQIMTKTCPAWIEPLPDMTGFKVIPERAKIVKKIFALTLKGVGVNKIAQDFNAKGLEPWGKGKKKAARWHVSYVQKILASPAVVGDLVDHVREYDKAASKYRRTPTGKTHKGYYPRIISSADFAKVQAQTKKNPGRGRARGGKISNLLAGLGKCPQPQCKGTMTNSNKGGNNRSRLVCAKAKAKAGCKCHPVSLDKIEAAIVLNVLHLAADIPSGSPETEAKLSAVREQFGSEEAGLEQLRITMKDYPEIGIGLFRELGIREKRVKELRQERDELLNRRQDSSFLVVRGRVKDLLSALGVEPAKWRPQQEEAEALAAMVTRDTWGRLRVTAPIDKAAVNACLKRLFESVAVDYRKKGDEHLAFKWHGGKVTRIPYETDKLPQNREQMIPEDETADEIDPEDLARWEARGG